MNDPTYFTRTLANPFYQILPTTVSRGSSTTIGASSLMDYYALWSGYTQADVADRNFRSDGLQLRFEKRAVSDKGGVLTWVTSYTWSKQYSRTCCMGQNWAYDKGAVLQLSPNGQTGTLAQYPYRARTPTWFTLPIRPTSITSSLSAASGTSRSARANTSPTRQGVGDKIVSGWRADWILTYISGNLIGLPGGINFCGNYVDYKDPASGDVIHNEITGITTILRASPTSRPTRLTASCRRVSPT